MNIKSICGIPLETDGGGINWELIDDVTVDTEDVYELNFNLSKEYEEVYIKIYASHTNSTANSDNRLALWLHKSNGTAHSELVYRMRMIACGAKIFLYNHCFIRKIADGYIMECTLPNGNTSLNGTISTMNDDIASNFDIIKLCMGNTVNENFRFAVGSRIQIYGR